MQEKICYAPVFEAQALFADIGEWKCSRTAHGLNAFILGSPTTCPVIRSIAGGGNSEAEVVGDGKSAPLKVAIAKRLRWDKMCILCVWCRLAVPSRHP